MVKINLFKIACVFTVIVSNTYCADYNKKQYDPSDYYKTKKWFEDIEREGIRQAEEIKRQRARNNNVYQVPKMGYKYAYTADGKMVPIMLHIDNEYGNPKNGQVVPIKFSNK